MSFLGGAIHIDRLLLLIVLVVVLVNLRVVVASNTDTSVTDTDVPGNEINTGRTRASNWSTSGAVKITMYTGDCE